MTAGRAATACADAIGHTGFTGTGLWVDFERGVAWSLLTNRVHPSRHRDSDIVRFAGRPATRSSTLPTSKLPRRTA